MKTNLKNLVALLSLSLWAAVSCDPPIEVETGEPVGGVRAETLEADAAVWNREPDVFDDFERADSVSLGRTPVGGYAWIGDRQTGPRIVDGAMRHQGTAGGRSRTRLEDFRADDLLLSLRVETTTEDAQWGVAYGQGDEVGYQLELADGVLELRSGQRVLASAELQVERQTWARVQLAVQEDLHRVWIDGVPLLDVVDTEGSASGGVTLQGSNGAVFDDLWIVGDPEPGEGTGSAEGGGAGGAFVGSAAGDGGASVVPGGDDPIQFGGGGGGSGGDGGDGGDGGAGVGLPDFVDDPLRNLGAPAPDLTVPTTLYKQVGFLYEGASPQQVGADLTVLEPSRIAHVYGWVRDAWGQPLAGVDVWALGHPELGTTTTRIDGSYDFVVTGGVPHSIVLSSLGYLTIHRKVVTTAGDSHRADDAVMLTLDPEASLITFDEPIEVHHAFTLNDGQADRMATVMFQQDTRATMVFDDESTEELEAMTVRLTEFTVGDEGPKRMPSPLPSGTAYNYAIEISADEAEAAGAVSVELDKPAVLYVDNFLDWPVGVVVPSGSYDRMVGRWVPEPDGRVVEIVGFGFGGVAELDIDGDGMADSEADLVKLGMTTDERAELGSIYAVGAQLWRTPIEHFTPYDLNPSNAPGEGPPDGLRPDESEGLDDCETGGSIIGIDTQDLGESLPIAGTPFSLEYRSGRTLAAPNRSLRIRTTGDEVPQGLAMTVAIGVVAGRSIYGFASPGPNAYAELVWDGLDAFGRPVQGPQPISLCVGWGFPELPVVLGAAGAAGSEGRSGFGKYPTESSTTHVPGGSGLVFYTKCYGNEKTVAAEHMDSITKADRFRLGGLDARTVSDSLGGWTLNVHHTLARSSATLYRGDGTERELADEALWTAQRFAGTDLSVGQIEGPANSIMLRDPNAVTTDAAGNVYVGTYGLVRRIDTNGDAQVVAGLSLDPDNGVYGYFNHVSVGFSGDGGPATSAELGSAIVGLAVDADGGIYIADQSNHRIRYVNPAGVIDTVAGSGSGDVADAYLSVGPYGGDPLQVSLREIQDIELTREGLLISQQFPSYGGAIRLLTQDRELLHIAGRDFPDYITPSEHLPAEPCPGDGTCGIPTGTIAPPNPHDTIPDLDEYLEGSHEVRAEWAWLSRQDSLAANDNEIFIAEAAPGSNNARIRRIAGLRGGNIYAFRKQYVVQEPLPCDDDDGCNLPTNTDLGVSNYVLGMEAEPSGLLYTNNLGELYLASDDLEIPQERIVGGPLADTPMTLADDIIPGSRLDMGTPVDLARGPDGAIYVADSNQDFVYRIARIVPPMYVASTVTSADGSELFLFDEEGRHLETRDARTHALIWSFGYDSEGRLIGVTDRFDDTTTIVRNGAGYATEIESPDGQSTDLFYDNNGYLEGTLDPAGRSIAFGVSDDGLLEWMTDSDSASAFGYDNDGRLTNDDAEILYDGQSEGEVNQVLMRTVSDETTVEVRHTSGEGLDTYYARTRTGPSAIEREVRFPDATVTSGYRRPEEEQATYADGTVTTARYTFDPRLGPNTRVPEEVVVSTPGVGVAGDAITTFGRSYVPYCTTPVDEDDEGFDEGCDPLDPQVDPELQADVIADTITRGDGTWTETYRRAHLEAGVSVPASVTLTTPMQRESVTALNDDGQVDTVSIPGRAPTTFGYDARGRLSSVLQTDGTDTRSTTYTYNAAGFVATVTDSLARTTSYQYDRVGRVTRQNYPDGRYVEFDYDEDGNLVSVTPPGRPAHTMRHDSLDRTRVTEPPALSLVPEPETDFEYDAEHRPTTVTRPDDEVMTLSYDPTTGKLDTVTTPTGDYVYSYDPTTGKVDVVTDPYGGSLDVDYFGYLPASETWTGTVAGSVSWTYDDRHRVETESVNGGETITIGYDADGNVEGVGDLDLELDPDNGELVGTTLQSVTSAHDANAFGEPSAITFEHNASPLYEVTFERDEVGRIHTKTEVRDLDLGGSAETIVRCYEYDLVGRLVDVYDAADSNGCTGSLVEHYGYDDNGNREEVTNDATYLVSGDIDVDDQDRLIDYGPISFTYTANGEVDTRVQGANTTDYDYDVSGNLVHVDLPDGTAIDYIYDARGRRIGKQVDGALQYGLLYGDQLNPVAQLDAMGAIQWRFVYGTRPNVPDYMVAASGGGTAYRFVTDQLGSVVAVVDAFTGIAVQELRYDSFGRVLLDTNEGFQPFGFAGGIYDPDTAWVLFGARDYRPEVGAWSAPDPTGFGGVDANLYRYAFADPVNLVDPVGESAVEFVAAIGDDMLAGIGLDGHAIRKNLGIADVVDVCSSDYVLGTYAALAVDFVSGAGAIRGGLKLLRKSRRLAREAAKVAASLCFAAGTVVAARDGPKAIEDIEIGELVWSRDDRSGDEAWMPVTEVFVTGERELLQLTFEGDGGVTQILRLTPDHPLWSLDEGEWEEAGRLDLGERVETLDGPVRLVAASAWPTKETVYNVEVAELHTYFVGEVGLWAHNVCVQELLRLRKGAIKNAPLPPGSPSWDDILDMDWAEVVRRANANEPGFKTIKKLLSDRRFLK